MVLFPVLNFHYPYLLHHCHGGGYVAASPKSHDVTEFLCLRHSKTYLRVWAELLSCSIVSVEYSLAPENSFPRPTEVLYTHVYIISNAAQLGWSGEKVFMIGDSASGNLVISVISKLPIEFSVSITLESCFRKYYLSSTLILIHHANCIESREEKEEVMNMEGNKRPFRNAFTCIDKSAACRKDP
uniref:Abhydrolase_3 domain-containing protein n=1 Tax=Wuchereria bancrofti TaxID=6293 RepID=A0A1I8E8Z0_WUCBA